MNKSIIYITVFIALVFQNIYGQNFSINGKLSDLADNAVVRLYDTEDKTIIDTTVVKDQKFSLKGSFAQVPRSVVLHIQGKGLNLMEYLYMGNEDVVIEGNLESFPSNLSISGSKFQKVKSKLDQQLLPLVKKQQQKVLWAR
jgi:hypothetical protein